MCGTTQWCCVHHTVVLRERHRGVACTTPCRGDACTTPSIIHASIFKYHQLLTKFTAAAQISSCKSAGADEVRRCSGSQQVQRKSADVAAVSWCRGSQLVQRKSADVVAVSWCKRLGTVAPPAGASATSCATGLGPPVAAPRSNGTHTRHSSTASIANNVRIPGTARIANTVRIPGTASIGLYTQTRHIHANLALHARRARYMHVRHCTHGRHGTCMSGTARKACTVHACLARHMHVWHCTHVWHGIFISDTARMACTVHACLALHAWHARYMLV